MSSLEQLSFNIFLSDKKIKPYLEQTQSREYSDVFVNLTVSLITYLYIDSSFQESIPYKTAHESTATERCSESTGKGFKAIPRDILPYNTNT